MAYDAYARAGDPEWTAASHRQVAEGAPRRDGSGTGHRRGRRLVLAAGNRRGGSHAIGPNRLALRGRARRRASRYLFSPMHRVLAPSTLETPVSLADLLFWLASGVIAGLFWAAAVLPPQVVAAARVAAARGDLRRRAGCVRRAADRAASSRRVERPGAPNALARRTSSCASSRPIRSMTPRRTRLAPSRSGLMLPRRVPGTRGWD